MIKNYNNALTRIGGIFVILVLIYTLAACTTVSNNGEDEKQDAEIIDVKADDETTDADNEEVIVDKPAVDEDSLPEDLVLGNYYKAVTNDQGSEDDGKLFAAGFIGFMNGDYYQVVADDYGYGHLSRVPVWSDGGGKEIWVIIPKYNDAKIELIATEAMTLADGQNVSSGDVIITAQESLVFFSNSTVNQSSVEVVVTYGDFSESFIPIASTENGAMSIPEYVWDISEYELTDASMELQGYLGKWIWEGEAGDNYTLNISQGSDETNSEGGYFMLVDSYYPGADIMGPYGGMLVIDDTGAIYAVNTSEGTLNTEIDIALVDDQLTVTWTGGDYIFNIRTLGESITFNRILN